MKYIIGVDLGTSGVKALLMSETGNVIGEAAASYSPDYPAPGYSEQDPAVWWENTKRVIKTLLAENKIKGNEVSALSVSGQMHGSVFLDAAGDSVRKAILWNDTRTTKQAKEIYDLAGGEAALLKNAQNRSLEGFTLPKILWLRENEPSDFAKTAKIILPKDFINYKLTGVIKSEVSDAAGTLLFNVHKRRWSEEIIKAVGLNSSLLPEVIESTDKVGAVSPEVAAELGLSAETLVLGGGADNSCAAIGNGVVREGQAVVSVGTSGTVVAFLKDFSPEKVTGDVHLFSYSYPNANYAMGVMMCAGESRNWAQKALLGGKSFEEMDKLAEKAAVGSGGLIFLPYLFGERCPNDAQARGMFFGINGTTSEKDFSRAVMEGVAFALTDLYNFVSDFTKMEEIYITGGGARSKLFGEIIASAMNRELTVLNVEQGPAFGAALIAGVGSGVFKSFDDAKDKTMKAVRTIKPNPAWVTVYENSRKIYVKLYSANKELFAEAARLR